MVDTQSIITVVVVLIVGIIMLSVLFDTTTTATTYNTVNAEEHNVTVAGVLYTLDNIPAVGTPILYNISGNGAVFSTPDDYNLTLATGVVNMSHPTNVGNNYSYQQTGYIDSAITQTILNQLPILFGVFLLAFVGIFLYSRKN